jgi:hypothetical protein
LEIIGERGIDIESRSDKIRSRGSSHKGRNVKKTSTKEVLSDRLRTRRRRNSHNRKGETPQVSTLSGSRKRCSGDRNINRGYSRSDTNVRSDESNRRKVDGDGRNSNVKRALFFKRIANIVRPLFDNFETKLIIGIIETKERESRIGKAIIIKASKNVRKNGSRAVWLMIVDKKNSNVVLLRRG